MFLVIKKLNIWSSSNHIVSYMMLNVILSAQGFTPSPPTLINNTPTTITVSWRSIPSDADGYVVNATKDTTGQESSQNMMMLKGTNTINNLYHSQRQSRYTGTYQ